MSTQLIKYDVRRCPWLQKKDILSIGWCEEITQGLNATRRDRL